MEKIAFNINNGLLEYLKEAINLTEEDHHLFAFKDEDSGVWSMTAIDDSRAVEMISCGDAGLFMVGDEKVVIYPLQDRGELVNKTFYRDEHGVHLG